MQLLSKITAPVLALTFVFTVVFVPTQVSAQTAQNCSTPDFQITSDSEIYALAGDTFSYFVVTENDTDFSLQSSLPAGLNYVDEQISGTPQTPGEYTLQFTAANECGSTSQSLTLMVMDSQSSVAQAETESAGSGSQGAAAGEVGLNEIPETGVAADTLLTVLFYMLALLALVGWAARRFSFATAGGDSNGSSPSEFDSAQYTLANPDKKSRSRRFGDGMRR